MESTTTGQQFLGAEASLSEPHFDEEATVLSARPVVPLAAIKEGKGSRAFNAASLPRPFILGLALAGTLLLGVFATAIYYSSLNRDDSQSSDDGQVLTGVEANSTRSADSFSGAVESRPVVKAETPAAERKEAPARNEPVKPSAEVARKPVPRLVSVITEEREGNGILTISREDRKAARREARQERRRFERERDRSDELLRIRDIFEGSPRP